MADFAIRGADKVERVGRRLKAAGDRELRKELRRGVNRATKPLVKAAKESALTELPRRGGLNEWVAGGRFSTSLRMSGRNPGVSIRAARKGHDYRAIDRGRLRHPVFGNRQVWVTQLIKPGFFTERMKKEAKSMQVRREIITVVDDVARKALRG